MAERAPVWYDVPPATERGECRRAECKRAIFFIKSPKSGNPMPVSCDVDGGLDPTITDAGKGQNHFAVSPDCARVFAHPRPAARRPRTQREMEVAHRPPQCITCGCTREKPCTINKEELDQVTADAVMERLGLEDVAEIPTIVTCVWLQIEPTPICSAPACKAQRDTLPLRLRIPLKHKTPAGAHA